MFIPPFLPVPTPPRARSARGEGTAPRVSAPARAHEDPGARLVEGLAGPVELRRAAGGYLQVWPRPTPESQRALYGEKFYEEDKATYLDDVARERTYWDAIWTIRREMMEAAVPAPRDRARRILDVGSSGGFLLDHFQQHGWQGFGIEPSRQAARHAREQFGLDVFCGELLDFDLESDGAFRAAGGERFDAVHCAQVLEHVLDPEACVARIAELVEPGGVVFVEVPNDFNVLQEIARRQLGKTAWWIAPDHHLNYFDAASLAALLGRHGLVEIDRVASFPIEMFLLMGEDYVADPALGPGLHERRRRFELALPAALRRRLYAAFASVGAGRNTLAFAVRRP